MDNTSVVDGNGQVMDAAGSSVYASDEFRLYCHKILPCSKRTPHDWASCHFAHPGEKAKRRNIRTHSYDCEMCPEIVKGMECKLGANCPHSHNVFESWLHPQKYRTMMCKDRDKCTRPVCFFAHGPHELRTPTDPTPLPQQLDMAAAAAATAAHAVPNQLRSATAGMMAGSSMQNWQLMQSQISELARGGSNVSMHSSGPVASGPSTPTATPVSSPAGLYPGPAASAAFLSPAGAGGHRGGSTGGCSSGSMALLSNGNMVCSPSSSSPGLAELAASEQVVRMLQQASNPAVASPVDDAHVGMSMQHLFNSMAQQVNVSRQEAQQCRNVAAQAQQQLAAIMAALGPQGPAVGSSAGMPVGGLPMGVQQLHRGASCASSNPDLYRDGSDLSTNFTYLERSSSTLPDFPGSATAQQQLYAAAVPTSGGSVWRCDSDGALVFSPDLNRSGSSSSAVSGASRLMHMVTGEGHAPGFSGSQSSVANPFFSAEVSAALSLQQQQQLRQALSGPAGDAPTAAAGLMGSIGGLGALTMQQQQLLQQVQAYQQGMQHAAGTADVPGARPTATGGAVGNPPVMYFM